jgi:hypothetical protein
MEVALLAPGGAVPVLADCAGADIVSVHISI